LKVPLKDAEKWKKYIVDNGLIDKEHFYTKDKEFIYFPVKEKFTVLKPRGRDATSSHAHDISFIEMEFHKSTTRKGTLKENLSKSLTKDEFEFVKAAHDIIGNIAILEIPKELEHHEKLIAETLLQTNNQIKTVLKKADIHGGVFRTQKMTYLAGIDTKETEYKENDVRLKLDVEKVYFSIRLGNERKRIMKLVQPGEEILVMFSGCAPYPVVLAKNTEAKHITGIEINPDGHKYGLENLKLNKIHNVLLVNDDVHNAIPKIYEKIIGLKASTVSGEIKAALVKNPKIFEFHLSDKDLSDANISKLENIIVDLKNKGLEVFIHVPHSINGSPYVLSDPEALTLTKKIGELCKRHFVSAIIHLSNGAEELPEENLFLEKIKVLQDYYPYFYFENLTAMFNTKEEILRISRKAGFQNICIDLAHLQIIYNDAKKVESTIKSIQKEFNTYFHIADSLGHDAEPHTCEISKGLIDFHTVLPLVNKGVIEVYSKDWLHPKEMYASYDALDTYAKKTYDRIIMPLPKTADEFLSDALLVSKKGTIIHFYDFLPETQFDEALKKIDEACAAKNLKHKILGIHKCGQHAPHIYRICVDFEIV
jgi:tRNA (guanine37-N1)-methyltransferase